MKLLWPIGLLIVGSWWLWLFVEGLRYLIVGDRRYVWHHRTAWRIMSAVLVVSLMSGLLVGGLKELIGELIGFPLRSKVLLAALCAGSLSEGWLRKL